MISLPKINSYQSTATNIFRNIKSIDVDKFCDDLESSLTPLTYDLIHSPLTPQSLNDNFNRLNKTISDVIETHAPLQTASRRQKRLQKRPWITKGILISIKNKQKLYKTFFLGGSDFEKSFYKIYANKLTRVKNLSKKLYYHSAIADRNSNPRELWKFIKTVIPSKRSTSSNPTELNVDDRTVEKANEIALTFNNHFVEIGRSIAQSIRHFSEVNFKMFLKKTVSQTIVLDPPQPIEIFDVISSLNPHKATGYDNISSYFLRIGNKILAPVLSLLFECVI